MNKNLFRIVFNKARGMLIATAGAMPARIDPLAAKAMRRRKVSVSHRVPWPC